MNAQLTAGLTALEEIYDGLIDTLNRADPASLDWTPPIPDANSTAALVRHIVGSVDSWLSRALDEPLQRDRDAEFRYSGSREDLIEMLNASLAKSRDQFARLDAVDPNAMRHYQRISRPDETEFTVAWCIEHALVHAAEHLGHIQLTQQFFGIR